MTNARGEYQRQYYAAHREEKKERERQYYAAHREEKKERVRKRYAAHREEVLERIKRRNATYRPKCLLAYGMKCACCGETNQRFLTIDHINGGGNKHRKEIKRTGNGFYRWLIDNGFPDGFQTLCYNCNCGKQVNNGVCPHKAI